MRTLFLTAIRGYQLFVSPALRYFGVGCRFHPSCSNYSKDAFMKYGCMKALKLTLGRIFRCHPFNPGGLDPVK